MIIKNRKVRITAIVEYFPPRLGGDRRIYELLKRLPREKYEITFLVLPPSYTLFIARIDKKPPCDSEMIIDGMRKITIKYPKNLLYLWQKTFLIAYILTLPYLLLKSLKAVIKISSDLIIVNNTSAYTGMIGYLLSIITCRKFLVDFNDLASEYTFEKVEDKIPRPLSRVIRLILRIIEDMILKRSEEVIIVHTGFLKKYAENRYKKSIIYIPDGVDTSKFKPTIINKSEVDNLREILGINSSKVCIYTGRLDKDIGGQVLYEVLKLLEQRGENVKCIILGEGDRDLIKKIKNLTTAIYLGLKSPEEIPRYLALADTVLIPFRQTKALHSVSPLKLFEALAMGKPIIASNILGIKDVVRNGYNGILVNNNPEEWINALKKIINKGAVAKRLSRNALATAKNYDWQILSERLEMIIKNINIS